MCASTHNPRLAPAPSITSRQERNRLCQNLDCAAAAEGLRSRPSPQACRTSDMADRGLRCLRRPGAGVLFPVGTGRPTRPFPVDQARRPGGHFQCRDRLGPRSLRSDLSARCRLSGLPRTAVRLGPSWRQQFRGLVHQDRCQPSSASSSCRVHGNQQHQPPHSWFPGVSNGGEYVLHPDALVALIPTALVLSCAVLFACDGACRATPGLPVADARVLVLAEATILWNVTVLWGHPEDTVAVALAIYALILAMDERFTGAGWLFGAALAFQPLVLMMFPVLIVMGGKNRALGLIVRGVVPAAVVTGAPLVANFHDTVHTLVTQPTFPYNFENHQTPWTFLAPRQGGSGNETAVGAGPMRIAVLALAAGVGWWAQRWRNRPEMIAWAVATTFALRLCFEVTMTDYYVWPPLAVGLVVAARCSRLRFAVSIAIAILTTVIAQWNLGWLPWWSIDVAGVAGLLVITSHPVAVVPAIEQGSELRRATVAVQGRSRSGSGPIKEDAPGRTRSPAVVQGRSKSGSGKKKRPHSGKKRSGSR